MRLIIAFKPERGTADGYTQKEVGSFYEAQHVAQQYLKEGIGVQLVDGDIRWYPADTIEYIHLEVPKEPVVEAVPE